MMENTPQSLGKPTDLTPRPFPERVPHEGRSVVLEPLSDSHSAELWAAADAAEASWTFLRYGPFSSREAMTETIVELAGRAHQPFWAVRPRATGMAQGWLSLCDVYREDAAIEIGSIWYSPTLQRTRAATEAVFLLMQHAFDELGYRRVVWRCLAQNAASCRAAERYGFIHEGIWRDAVIIKRQQRDVAWFSMLANEWSSQRTLIARWLSDDNFNSAGTPLASLSEMRRGVLGGQSKPLSDRETFDQSSDQAVLEINTAEVGDVDQLLPLITAFFREEGIETPPEAQRRNLLAMMAAPDSHILLAKVDDQPVAFATATLTRGIEFGLAAEIEDLYVDPEARGGGIARRLMGELLDWCESQGAQEIIVVITSEGMEAIDLPAFYRRFGFHDSGRKLLYRTCGREAPA